MSDSLNYDHGDGNGSTPYVAPAWKKPTEDASTIRVVTDEDVQFLNIFTVSGKPQLDKLGADKFAVRFSTPKARIGIEFNTRFLIFELYQNENVLVEYDEDGLRVELANPSDERPNVNFNASNGLISYSVYEDDLEILWKR